MPRPKKQDPRKLTLRLEGEVIDAAKAFAEERGTSLSEMVEDYFRDVAMGAQAGVRERHDAYRSGPESPTVESPEPTWARELPPTMRASLRAIRDGQDPGEAIKKIPPDEFEAWRETLSPNVRALLGIAKPRPGEKEVTKEDRIRYLEQKYR